MSQSSKGNHERGWHRLFYTKDGDLDLSWLLVSVFAATAVVAATADILHDGKLSWHAWSFFAGAFLSVFISAIPMAKARLLANSKAIGDFSKAVGGGGGNVWTDNERDPQWGESAPNDSTKTET